MITYLSVFVPVLIAVISMLIHIETSIASLKSDVSWIKKMLNNKNKERRNE